MYEKILKWYTIGTWDDAKVRKAVEAGKITEAEYESITGREY